MRKITIPDKFCLMCGRPLFQRYDEQKGNFKKRKFCDIHCARAYMRREGIGYNFVI